MRIVDRIQTPLGSVWAAVEDGRLAALRIGARGDLEGMRGPLPAVRGALERWFATGEGEVDLVPAPTEFLAKVRKAVRAIPRGETRTYGEVARAAGRPGAARAVGQAMARNPIPLLVPCHRVVASGGPGGYSGGRGLATKSRLLALERSR
jgi:methylated-DNA-[protein]-cysteine S-methyltransferase